MPPAGLAKFDSATATLSALARFLHGQDFPALAQPAPLRTAVRFADHVPRRLRERAFALLGAQEAVAPDEVDRVDATAVAEWASQLYPRRRYPAVIIGSASGALVHLAAAFGIPWLPQTFLTLVRQKQVHPDDAVRAMEEGRIPAQRFLEANPDVQLHHMQDPNQDRLMLGHITYFRFKYRRLPLPYQSFLERSLAPGGTIIIAEGKRRWPVTRLGERYVYQFGAVGGPTQDEYFHGGERVEQYLRRYHSPFTQWQPPAPDDESPEAEWGFEPALGDEIDAFARERGYRVLRIPFQDPEDLSPAVAEMYRHWHAGREIPENRLVIESFVMLEPYWVLRTGSVPFWMTFNMEPSLRAVERYLADTAPYDHRYLMLFAHGVDSVGLPPISAWRRLLEQGGDASGFLGVNPDRYPAHFAAFARYSARVRALEGHYPIPPPLPIDRLDEFIGRWREP